MKQNTHNEMLVHLRAAFRLSFRPRGSSASRVHLLGGGRRYRRFRNMQKPELWIEQTCCEMVKVTIVLVLFANALTEAPCKYKLAVAFNSLQYVGCLYATVSSYVIWHDFKSVRPLLHSLGHPFPVRIAPLKLAEPSHRRGLLLAARAFFIDVNRDLLARPHFMMKKMAQSFTFNWT